MTIKYPSTRNLIRQICNLAKESNDPQVELLIKFIKYFYSYTALEDLEKKSISCLYGIALSQWRLLSETAPDQPRVRIFNASQDRDGWSSQYTMLQVVMKDIPFLVDSLRMEINRLNLNYHLLIHMGGMVIKRDQSGKITKVERYKGQEVDGEVESPVFMEIDFQSDPKTLEHIHDNVFRVLHDVSKAVCDWSSMKNKLDESVEDLKAENVSDTQEVVEAVEFLQWLLEDNFTFLGMRDYEIIGEDEHIALRLIPGSGLGVLADDSSSKKHRLLADLPEQAQRLILSNDSRIIISKTNTISTVHRPVYTDYVGVKRFDENNKLIGERRFIGLYTSTAYSCDPLAIPFLRHKVSYVLNKSQLPEESHSGKDLRHILSTLPRDDLFQATTDELFNLSMGILHLQERRCIRLFAREDAYGRYMSCFVFVPRDKFSTTLLRIISDVLMTSFNGLELSFNTSFTTSVLARIHFTVRIDSRKKHNFDLLEIERQLIEAGKSWNDEFRENAINQYGNTSGSEYCTKYADAFSPAYKDAFEPHQAVYDVEYMERLGDERGDLSMMVYRPLGHEENLIRFKLFRYDETMPLSDALPILENLGFRVIGEEPYSLKLPNDRVIWLNDFGMEYIYGELPPLSNITDLFQDAFIAIWRGRSENDKFNHLVIHAGFRWDEISLFRAYTKYLQQLGGLPFSLTYVAETFIHNPDVAKVLLKLFRCLFDPDYAKKGGICKPYEDEFFKLLDSVESLDEDRTFRRFLDLLKATLRTNFYQKTRGNDINYTSFKFSPKDIPGVPLPLPQFEVFVYSPDFEGVHLRMAKVARGGLRWSDRREDFRTEVLGLMKAQQVKNSVIVPSGAKGGFVVKKSSLTMTRDEFLKEGVRCYQGFIHGLLDITDNIVNGEVVHPERVIFHDEDDPYLVVAADKGTATFSDIANKISEDKGFWLGDAFASGGSTGYDHKKMGITARGAWVSAERQFQEIGINVDLAPVKIVGIGDMAGDVFGNGLLMSPHLKLVAAFNHMHIFIDPDPDPASSYEERKRLFDLPRSSWEDYNAELISKGGGIFLRSAKSIPLSAEMQALLDVEDEKMVPNDLLRALLKAPIDMIWNGGIGTYIKAEEENNVDVGDRANDYIRVNGKELRARVFCEGGNLGATQLGRIEFELIGGKINTDFIDNSAGVDCSDHEVNIKILMNDVVSKGDLTEKQRNELLARMTEEVGALVLQNNYHQNEALSLAAYSSARYIEVYRRYMAALEEYGKLNRELEFLPTNKTIIDRKSEGIGLTKPELAVLLAYAKIVTEEELRTTELMNDPYVKSYAMNAFPTPLRKTYAKEIKAHRLYPEIAATQISNRMVSDMGITFVYTMFDETGANLDHIVRAYVASHSIFHMEELYADIESLDYKVDAKIQYEMMIDIVRLVRRSTRWFLRNRRDTILINPTIKLFSQPAELLYKSLPKLLTGSDKAHYENRCEYYMDAGVPAEIAYKIASTDAIFHALNIVDACLKNKVDFLRVAQTYFAVVDRLDLLWFRNLIDTYPNDTHWMILAKSAYKGDLDWIQRELTLSVFVMEASNTGKTSLNDWVELHKSTIERWEALVTRLKGVESREFAMLSVAIRELSDITRAV
jgi:glutamate dehydrogenase